jgi:YVTN family beta-propeller protein
VGSGPDDLAITPDGKTAYVASINSGTVTPIATATNTADPPIPLGFDTFAIAITPDGKTAYVAKGDGTVTPIATATNTAGPPIPAGPGVIAITPDGKTAYVANQISDTVTPIVTATNTVGPPITVGGSPVAIAITPGHRHSRGRLHQRLRQHAHSPEAAGLGRSPGESAT